MNPLDPAGLVQLVATPIGNLGDITFRAAEAIRQADIVACEDTRHSRRLLEHLGIREKELVALHDHNERFRAASLVERVRQGPLASTMTMADLAGYRPIKREALCGRYRAYRVCGPPPPASG